MKLRRLVSLMKHRGIVSLMLALPMLAAPLSRSTSYAAQTLQELLEQTRTIHPQEEQENTARQQRFEADRDHQAALFSQVQEETKTLENTSHQLSSEYD